MVAYILSLLAGLLMVVGGLLGAVLRVGGMQMMRMARSGVGAGFGGVLGIACGLVVLVSALMLLKEPKGHVMWGTLVIVFSVFSLFGGAGLGVGLLLGLVGGVLAVTWAPTKR